MFTFYVYNILQLPVTGIGQTPITTCQSQPKYYTKYYNSLLNMVYQHSTEPSMDGSLKVVQQLGVHTTKKPSVLQLAV